MSILDQPLLRRLAGPGSFARGADYFARGNVRALDEHRGMVVATVQGTTAYAVKLWGDGKDLGYSCTCPRGDDGECCKHCVAVGLAVLAGTTRPSAPRRPRPKTTLDDVREYLANEPHGALVDLLMDRAVWDDALREQLLLKAASRRRNGAVDVGALKEALDQAIDPGDYLDRYAARDYANGVEDAVKTIEEILDDGHAAEAVDLAEHALGSAEEALGSVDDSDGQMGSVLDRLQELHLRACKRAKPDPVGLARRLFAREIGGDYDVFRNAVSTYAKVLGKCGIAEYRRLAEARWKTIKPLHPGQDDSDRYGARFRISSIMMALAKLDGDVEAQAGVLQRDLSSAFDFLQVAELYRKHGRHERALEWAEKGLRAFPRDTDPRLREFVADAYHRGARHDDAMAVAWAGFLERRGVEEFRNLKRHADRAGAWAAWREKALAAVREEVARRKRAADTSEWGDHRGNSTLVEIHLWEGDVESAWQEAQAGGCSRGLWMVLAEKREKAHPEDALPIYQREVESTLREAHAHAYVAAVKLLKTIQRVMKRMGARAEFATYLETVRTAHARKRNFVRLLARANWG